MGNKKDPFDKFMEKQFGEASKVRIATPAGGERTTSFEERRAAAAAAAAAVPEPAAPEAPAAEAPKAPSRPGRKPKYDGDVMNMNFLIERDLKNRLEMLKIELYRTSVTDLLKEAIHDLLVKYGKE